MDSSDDGQTKRIITALLTSNPLRCTIKQLCNDFINTVGYKVPIQQLGFHNVEQYLRSIPDTVIIHGSGPNAEVEGIVKPKSAHISEMVAKQKKNVPKNKRKYIKSQPRRGQQQASFSRNSYSPNRIFTPVNPPSVSFSTCQINLSNEPHTSSYYNYLSSDLSSPRSLTSSEELNKTECKRRVSTSDDSTSSWENNYRSKIPPGTQNNLRKLILQFPDGIWCTQLPSEYKKMFKKKLCYEEYNYRSLIEMCSDLPEIFQYIQPTSDDFILYDKNKPIPSLNQNELTDPVSSRENVATTNIWNEVLDLNWDMGPALIPPDVLHPGDRIPRYALNDDVQEGDYLEVSIGEIYDISKFWVYLTFGELKSLMNDLNVFFHNQRNKYFIPEVLLEEGLYCTCLYAGEFHRAVIVNLLPKLSGFVRVLFIDYGTVGNIRSNEIWYLPKQFGKVPFQAIRTRLSKIYPVYENRPWSVQAINRFRELITKTVLIAEVTNVDREDNILEIYLADITDENNIFYINDVLVDEGYALYVDQKRKPTLVDEKCRPRVNYIHLFPEFDEIEAGNAPTTDEMNYIIKSKIPMHHYMPRYFDICFNEDVDYIQKQHEKFNRVLPNFKIKPAKVENLFDLSFFPPELQREIKDLVDQENKTKTVNSKPPSDQRSISESLSKVEESGEGDNSTNQSFKEYFCNRKRILALMNVETVKTVKNEHSYRCESQVMDSLPHSRTYSECSSSLELSQEEAIPLNNTLKKLTLNSSDSVVNNNGTNPFKSTNPFLNDFDSDCSPFRTTRSTNPFANDIEETAKASDLFEIFSKSSQEKLQEKIVNNLSPPRNTCTCKVNKNVNLNVSENITPSNILNNSNPFKVTQKNDAVEELPRRVRTPPGFRPIQHNASWNPNNTRQFYNMNTYMNPYYQNMQFNNLYFSQNQYNSSMVQNCLGMWYNFIINPEMFRNRF